MHLFLLSAALRAAIPDNAVVAADRVAVNRVVDRAVADARVVHRAHNRFKRIQILGRVAVHLDVGDVTRVRQRVIRRFQPDLVKRADRAIHRDVEAVGVILAIGHARDFAVALLVELHKPAGKPLRRGRQQRVIQLLLRAPRVAALAHVADDLQSQLLRALALAVVLADERHQRLRQTDEADGQRAVLEHFAHLVVPAQLLAVHPNALAHQERIIAHLLARLNLKAFVELLKHQIHPLVQRLEEQLDVALALNGDARQVDRREGQVAAAVADLARRVVHVANHAGAAAHVGDFRLVVAGLVILEVERRIHKRKIREEALGAHANRQPEQVVVRVAGVVAHALLDAENLNRENRRFAVAQSALRRQQQVAHHHARLRRGIHAVVDGGERRLRARAGVHRVQVVDERLHRLIGAALRLAVAALGCVVQHALDGRLVRHRRQALAQRVVKFLVRLERRGRARLGANLADDGLCLVVGRVVIQQQIQRGAERAAVFLDVGFGHAGRHVVIKAGDGLTAVLIVLVALDGNAGQRGIAADVLRLAQHAVAGRKTALEQLRQVDLGAGRRQRQEVEVVDVDVALAVRARVLRVEHVHVVKLLGALRAVLEHRAHRGIAVDVRVLALHIGFGGVLERDVLQNVHQAGFRLAGAAALRAIEDVCLRRLGVALGNQHALHLILNILDGGRFVVLLRVHLAGDNLRQAVGLVLSLSALRGHKRAVDGGGNFGLVVGHEPPVALFDVLRHIHSLPCLYQIDTIFCNASPAMIQHLVFRVNFVR